MRRSVATTLVAPVIFEIVSDGPSGPPTRVKTKPQMTRFRDASVQQFGYR